LKSGLQCNYDVRVVSVHATLGLSVHASLFCTYQRQSSRSVWRCAVAGWLMVTCEVNLVMISW